MGPAPAEVPEASRQRVVEVLQGLPLIFEANQGQTDPQVDFLARGRGYTLFLSPTQAALVLRGRAAESELAAATPSEAGREAEEKPPGAGAAPSPDDRASAQEQAFVSEEEAGAA